MKSAKNKRSIFLILFSIFAFIVAAILLTIGNFFAESSGKISQDLQQHIFSSQPGTMITVIAQYYEEPQKQDSSLLQGLGARIINEFDLINAFSIEIPADKINELAQSARVKNLSPDRQVHACLDVVAPTVSADTAINYYGMTGSGVTVAILDSGIVANDELLLPSGKSRIIANADFVHDTPIDGLDTYGHGTYIAGIIGMKTHRDLSRKIINTGIAPESFLVSVKVLDSDGTGKVSSVIEGIQWCIDHAALYNIRVLNLSLSHPIYESFTTDPLAQACEKAWNAGLVVVAPAGNHGQDRNGYGSIGSPGNDPYIITVGATNDLNSTCKEDDTLPEFSSKGPALIDFSLKPDLVAPGAAVSSIRVTNSTLDTEFPLNRISHDGITFPYFRLSGSSISTAIVSGAAALIIQKTPSLTPPTIKARLMKSSDKTLRADIYTRGAGYLNVLAALLESGIATSSKSPRVYQTNTGITLEKINWDTSSYWKERPIWGNETDWGEDNIYGDLSVWGSNANSAYQEAWNSSGNEESSMIQ